MTESRACSCWQQVTLHDGHCCFIDVPDDHPIGTPPPCGHADPLPTGAEIKPGDRVYVTDPALADLRRVMRQYGHDPEPNHYGTVHEIYDDGDILVHFDDGIGAPYPPDQVRLLSDGGGNE